MLRRLFLYFLIITYNVTVWYSMLLYREKPEDKPSVHSHDCQQKNYLLADCWDNCNPEAAVHKKDKNDDAAVVIELKFIDKFFLSTEVVIAREEKFAKSIFIYREILPSNLIPDITVPPPDRCFS